MRTQLNIVKADIIRPLLTATLTLAITFTLSCSSDSGGDDGGKQPDANSGTEISSSSKVVDDSSSSNEIADNSSSSNEVADNSSSSNEVADNSSSSNEVADNSSSSNEVADNSSSSSGSDGGSVKKEQIRGVSQKGPFAKGSAITLSELNEKLAQTGRSFEEMITDDKGSFEIKNIELVSPYAMLKANGFYRNEVTGKISTAPINLYAIADIREKSNVNVNILTHLEYYRVQKLVGDGKSLKEAKKQAQKEILAVFGISGEFKDSEDMSIFGTSDGDAALLAISVLLQGNLTEGQFTERLTDFSLGFKETGAWDNETEKDAMAVWASGVNLNGIRSNILGWNLSSTVPDFEKYVNNYWAANYGLEACDAVSHGSIKTSNKGVDYICYICKDKAWAIATDYELDVGGLGNCSTAGEIKKGSWSYKEYICRDSVWVIPTKYDLDVDGSGNCSTAGEIKNGNVSGTKYICKNNVWVIATKCLESKSCSSFTDARDNQSYYYVAIGEQTWMAENLNYNATGSVCYDNYSVNCEIYGRLYDFETANKVCPAGWHLPSDAEWTTLMNFVGFPVGTKLKSANGWNSGSGYIAGTDIYGFSALPGGIYGLPNNYGNSSYIYYDVGDYGLWWSATEQNSLRAWYRDMDYNDQSSSRMDLSKSYLISVRCLED